MAKKWTGCTFLAFLLLFLLSSQLLAVNPRYIDVVRKKGVLDADDFLIIDSFLKQGIRELVKSEDFSSVAQLRTIIVSRKSDQAQYAQQFSKSSLKYISEGFKTATALASPDLQFKASVNLLILIDQLEDIKLADLAINMLGSENNAVQYWAVHALSNEKILSQLSSDKAHLALSGRVTDEFSSLVETAAPETIRLMTEFAARINNSRGEVLLLKIADNRIRRYQQWNVDSEMLDMTVLKMLAAKIGVENSSDIISARGNNRTAMARQFGQLYSYAIQRYIKGQEVLDVKQKHQLASVLIELESCCIWKILDDTRTTSIKRAIEREDFFALLDEHNRLLGDKTTQGLIPIKLDFNYGQNSNGSKLNAPLKLSDPPPPANNN